MDKAEKVIFPKKAISFGFNSSLGAYAHIDGTPDFVLEAGKDYIIEWGEKQVMRTAFAFTFADGSQCVGAGDPVAAGQQSNGDLFCLVNDITNNLLYFLSLQEVSTVEVTVYAVADDLGGNDHPDETVILPAGAVAFAPGVNGLGEPIYTTTFLEFELVRWRKYRVSWEGEETVLMAYPGPNGVVCLGNLFITGSGENTGERFLIVYGDGYSNIATYEAGESREVAIWLTNEVGIVLQDYTEAERAYYDIDRLRVDTTDGNTVEYIHDSLVPETVEKTVELDFSVGPMTVTPGAGQAFSMVNIPVPDGLDPDNIAEGVRIAGVEGNLKAGGGGPSSALIYSAVKNFNNYPTNSSYSLLIASSDELAACGIDLTQFTTWYKDGQAYVPFIELAKLLDRDTAYKTTYRCITGAWVSNIAQKPSSGSYWKNGQWCYANESGAFTNCSDNQVPNTVANPLASAYSSNNSSQVLCVKNGGVYVTPYYSSSVRYSLVGTYLVTVMLIPTF